MAVKVSTLVTIGIIVFIVVGAVFLFAPRFRQTTSGLPDFIILVSPSSPTVARLESSNVTVEVRSLNNFASRVSLSVNLPGNPPSNVTAKLEKPLLILFPNVPAPTKVMFKVGNAAPPGTYNYTVTGEGGGITRSSIISLQIVLNPAIIAVKPGEQTVLVTTTFKVNVTISDIFDMYGWGITLIYDPGLLENVTTTVGPDWQAKIGIGRALHFWTGSETGKIVSSLTLFNPEPSFSGNSTLIMIEFRALGPPPGKTVLRFDTFNTQVVKFIEGGSELIRVRTVNGNVTIVSSSSSAPSSSLTQGSVSQGTLLQTSDAFVSRSRDSS